MIRFILAAARRPAGRRSPRVAERIKDLGEFQGIRTNQLTGYGIVVGLPGTGDDNLEYTVQSMKGVASRFGLQLPPGVNPGAEERRGGDDHRRSAALRQARPEARHHRLVDGQGQVACAAAR